MTVDGIECPLCGDQIWSRHRHDFRQCTCGKTFVDGGRDYLRYGGGGGKMPKMIKLDVEVSTGKTKSARKPQRQDSLTDQINDLIDLAEREGLYDASDWIRKRFFENG